MTTTSFWIASTNSQATDNIFTLIFIDRNSYLVDDDTGGLSNRDFANDSACMLLMDKGVTNQMAGIGIASATDITDPTTLDWEHGIYATDGGLYAVKGGVATEFADWGAIIDTFPNRTFFTNTNDVGLTGISGAVIIGGDGTGTHIAIDGNEIMAKTSPTAAGQLALQWEGGTVALNKALLSIGDAADTTDPKELLRFNTERKWSFRKRNTGASTSLRLESDGAGKVFWIGYDDGVNYAAKFTIQTATASCLTQFGGQVNFAGVSSYKVENDGDAFFKNLSISTAHATIDTDKFLVSDSNIVKYRTGAEVLSDIGAEPSFTTLSIGSGGTNATSFTSDYMIKYDGSKLANSSFTETMLEQYFAIGSTNMQRVPLVYQFTSAAGDAIVAWGGTINALPPASSASFMCTLPCNIGSLSLKVYDVLMGIMDADSAAYLDRIYAYGYNGHVRTELFGKTLMYEWTIGEYSARASDGWTTEDLGAYDFFTLRVDYVCDSQGEVDITNPYIDYFYS